jgi:hypothetical protein
MIFLFKFYKKAMQEIVIFRLIKFTSVNITKNIRF